MDIKERLEKENVTRLKRLAKQLGVTGYSGLNKQPLIDLIINNRSLDAITTALIDRVPWWKRIKRKKLSLYIGIIGSIFSIIGVFLGVSSYLDSIQNQFDYEKAFENIPADMKKKFRQKIKLMKETWEKS